MAQESSMRSKPVQELLNNSDEVPERYIYKDTSYGDIDTYAPLMDIPVINMGRLISSPSTGLEQELQKLRSALTSWGCFMVINHGVEKSFLDEVGDVAKQFFHLPMQEKQKHERAVDDTEGYGNDMILSESQTLDWGDRLFLYVSPEDMRRFKYWPQIPKSFRQVVDKLTSELQVIEKELLKSMAKSLDLEEKCFLNQCGDKQPMIARFNMYPPCRKPENVLGFKPHADASTITILLQDKQVQGLQVLKDGHWFQVPIMSHALLVNAGDQLEIMSNGIFKSPVHRVVTNSEMERMSVAVFFAPEAEKEIEPLEELVSNTRPKMFKRVKNYDDTFFHYYQQGKRPIDVVRI